MENEAKKILYAASTASHLENFHAPYISLLARAGCRVTVCCRGIPETEGAAEHIELPFEKKLVSPRNFILAAKLARRLREDRCDLISVHTSLAAFFVRVALMLAGKGNTRVINTVHGYLFDENTPAPKRRMMLAAEKLTAPVTDRVIAMNAADYELARRERLGGRISFTDGMGVDFGKFDGADRARARRELGFSDGQFVILCAAEFSRRKNQSMLIKAAAELPEGAVIAFAGAGDELERCRELARSVPGRVRFLGYVRDMRSAWAAADACVSASRSEGLPYNVMEAMYFALPCVVSDVKGNNDLIRDGENGYLYPFGDASACAEKLRMLMEDAEKRRAMGAKARDDCRRYALENVMPKMAEILGEELGIELAERQP
ncbi:MAG: glycosyltransferase family 4 protein [Oscillospiraceae bacterium]|nr:glycosyltransferase family 4 protein [Oscillospiraceae bacterium]